MEGNEALNKVLMDFLLKKSNESSKVILSMLAINIGKRDHMEKDHKVSLDYRL